MGLEYIIVLGSSALTICFVLLIFWPMQGLFILMGLRLLLENPPFLGEANTSLITNAFGGGVLLLAMLLKVFRKNFVIFVRPVTFFFLFIFVASFSFVNLEFVNLKNYIVTFLKYISMPCMFLLTYNSVKDMRTGDKALLYFVLISIPPVVYGYLQFFMGTASHFSNYWGQHYDRIFSTFAHSNQFAFYLAMVAFALMLMVQKKIFPRLSLLYTGIVIVAILLTYSLAVWLTMGVCLAGLMISSRKLWVPAIVGGVFLVVFLSPLIRSGTEDVVDRKAGQINSVDMRIKITRDLMYKAFPQKPFLGFGLGTSKTLVEKYSNFSGLPPHNDYIRILVETGALGLIAFVLYLLSLFSIPIANLPFLLTNIHLKTYCFMVLFLSVILVATNHLGNVSTMGMWFALLGIVYKLLQLSYEPKCV